MRVTVTTNTMGAFNGVTSSDRPDTLAEARIRIIRWREWPIDAPMSLDQLGRPLPHVKCQSYSTDISAFEDTII